MKKLLTASEAFLLIATAFDKAANGERRTVLEEALSRNGLCWALTALRTRRRITSETDAEMHSMVKRFEPLSSDSGSDWPYFWKQRDKDVRAIAAGLLAEMTK